MIQYFFKKSAKNAMVLMGHHTPILTSNSSNKLCLQMTLDLKSLYNI